MILKMLTIKITFVLSNTVLRGHEFKLFKGRFNSTIRKHSFSQRVIDHWNNLSHDVVACTSVLQFKKVGYFHEIWRVYISACTFFPLRLFVIFSDNFTLNHVELLCCSRHNPPQFYIYS